MESPSPSPPRHLLVKAHQVFDGETMRGPCLVEMVDGLVRQVHDGGNMDPVMATVMATGRLLITDLPPDAILAPGFIDVQVNGGGGVLLNDEPSSDTIRHMAEAHRRYGTTGLLPTLITDSPGKMVALADIGREAMAIPGVLGFHLEGPFLNPARKGIHSATHMHRPGADDIARLLRFSALGASLVTLAPEQFEAAMLRQLAASGLRLSIGHSDATATDVSLAVACGVSSVTHLFNAMSQMLPRAPGIVGSTLSSDDLFAGIICDGHHVDAANLKVVFRAKGRDRLMLVTDAMATVGSRKSHFMLQGRRIRRDAGRLLDENGTLSGAHLSMIDAVHNAVEMMDVSLEDALVMASRTPARFLGLDDSLGRIVSGHRADLVAFSGRDVLQTWIDGNPAMRNSDHAKG